MKLHYCIEGPKDGPKLVLINGLFADLESWSGGMEYLRDFRVLRYDGRGQGQSPKPREAYDVAVLVDDLLKLLNQLSWQQPLLAGISHGGTVAMQFAATHPQRVTAVVAAACCDRVSPILAAKLEAWLKAHLCGGGALRFDVALPWIWANETLREHGDLVASYRQRAGKQLDYVVRGLIESALGVAVPSERITCPIHLLAAREDVLVPPDEMWALHSRIAQSSCELIDGAHACLLERPDLVNTALLPALRRFAHVD